MSRANERDDLARKVNRIPSHQLLKWGITRPGDVTGLDTIGIPAYTVPRPPGTVLTISSGKGLQKFQAKASAILEGLELFAVEHPDDSPHLVAEIAQAKQLLPRVLDKNLFAIAANAPVYDHTIISFDQMDDFKGGTIFVPSDLVWMEPRVRTPFLYFQTSSNGLSAGYSRRDAELSALYETIERDGWGISEFIRQQVGQWSPRISLECNLPGSIRFICDKLDDANVIPFVFDFTTDIGIPTFGCFILDVTDTSPGAFSGYGCHLDSETALRRAMTEATQSRCNYISGARDDMLRRRFMLMKRMDHEKLLALFNLINYHRSFDSYELNSFQNLESEWDELLKRIEPKVTELYSKVLYHCPAAEDVPEIFIVRVMTPQLETPVWDHWAPGQRAIKALQEFA